MPEGSWSGVLVRTAVCVAGVIIVWLRLRHRPDWAVAATAVLLLMIAQQWVAVLQVMWLNVAEILVLTRCAFLGHAEKPL